MHLFGVTEQTVFNAIGYKGGRGDTATARRIRSYILQNGGVIMNESPEIETFHDAEGKMRQYFPNGALIEIYKQTGELSVFYNGEKVVSFEDVKVWQLELLQDFAQKLKAKDVEDFLQPEFRERWKRGIQAAWADHKELGAKS